MPPNASGPEDLTGPPSRGNERRLSDTLLLAQQIAGHEARLSQHDAAFGEMRAWQVRVDSHLTAQDRTQGELTGKVDRLTQALDSFLSEQRVSAARAERVFVHVEGDIQRDAARARDVAQLWARVDFVGKTMLGALIVGVVGLGVYLLEQFSQAHARNAVLVLWVLGLTYGAVALIAVVWLLWRRPRGATTSAGGSAP